MGNNDCSYSWFDELLCEYVDGTMDPAVRRVFEEYLHTDPVLLQQVERLRDTRKLLCRHGCHTQGTRGLQARVRRRLAREMMCSQPPFFPQVTSQLGFFVAVGSVMAAMVMVGLLVGAVLLAEKDPAIAVQHPTIEDDAAWHREASRLQSATMTPLPDHRLNSVPAFARQSILFPVRHPESRWPEVFPPEQVQAAALQRTSVTP